MCVVYYKCNQQNKNTLALGKYIIKLLKSYFETFEADFHIMQAFICIPVGIGNQRCVVS